MDRTQIPSPAHAVGDVVSGFRIDQITPLEDIRVLCYEATHLATGAQLIDLHCHDEENMFCVGFATPPQNSTGVAHILEHSVLAGSRRFPVKDAFNELGKRTMKTFLNAMTWPDRTIYPVCSAVRQDYFNLASVYLDLVFHPLLKRETFMQEGHHLTLADLDDPASALSISGVVYNEMKGVYSSPESVAERETLHAIFPDTTYGVDSGGDPEVIPELTYEEFSAFHRRYYSPTNARFLLYGDVDPADNLAFLAEFLADFEAVEVDASIAEQPRWSAPQRKEYRYAISADEPLEKKSFVTLNWMVNETADVLTTLLMDIAVDALVGSAAGPLRKALIESDLGQDLFPGGSYETDLRQAMVSFGLRETDAEHAEAIEALILETLRSVAEGGLDRELIEASLHQIEFHGKEISPPFPVMLMMRANKLWFYGADPKEGLCFSALVERARQALEARPRLLEELIREQLIENPHRLTFVLRPDRELAERESARFAEKMAARRAEIGEAGVAQVRVRALELREQQEQADTPEAIATLPQLALGDIPREVRTIRTDESELHGRPLLVHPLFSNGIGYLGLAFDLRGIDPELLIDLPLLGKVTLGMGAAGLSYEQMAVRVSQSTGGLSFSSTTGAHLHSGEPYAWFTLDGKALARRSADLVAIFRDFLTRPDLTDHRRLRELVLESSSQAVSNLIPAGHRYAYLRAAAALGGHYRLRERWSGVTQVKYLKEWSKRIDSSPDELVERLGRLQRQLFCRERLLVSIAGDPAIARELEARVAELIAALPAGTSPSAFDDGSGNDVFADTGVVISAQVNYVGQVLPLPTLRDEHAADFEMLASVLSNDFCYKRIRVQGGAYGGFCLYSADDGHLALLSYRDPNLDRTYGIYRGVVEFAKTEVDDEAIEASRIGAIADISRILSAGQTLRVARARRFSGIDDTDRQRFRDGLFATNAERIRTQALPVLESAFAEATRAALASRERLEAFNREQSTPLTLFTFD